MKRLLAVILVLTFVLPSVAPWLPHNALDALHTQQEAHHKTPDSHSHGDHHGIEASNIEHKAHFDIIAYFDNLHVDLKNQPITKLITASENTQNIPFILVSDYSIIFSTSWAPKQSQGPPSFQYAQIASLGNPVYLTTQRLRI